MRLSFWTVFLILVVRMAAAPEAILLVVGDQHSAYDKLPHWVARVDQVLVANPGVPLAVLVDGDAFEYGNAIARRTNGVIDFAVFEALAHRAPTILNLGNHEPDLLGMGDVVARLQSAGVAVISGNARNRTTGQPYAPASTRLKLGEHELTIVGVTTDSLATFRVAVRPDLDLADPVVWGKQNLPALLRGAELPVVMSHAGLRADRQLFGVVPPQTLFVGAHDHLRFVHREGKLVYFHSGSWLDGVSIVTLESQPDGLVWQVEQQALQANDPQDKETAALVAETLGKALTPEETAIVGRTAEAMSPPEAALFAVRAAQVAAKADAAVIGGTTFGAGLPRGEVSRYAFDACVRFDGPLCVGTVTGEQLKRLLARANQGPDTPFAERTGENLVATGPALADIDPIRAYRIVTSDWIARNPAKYLGENPPTLTEVPNLRLKAAVAAALQP